MICLWLAVTGSGRDFGIPDDSFDGSFFSQKNTVGVWKNEKPPSIWLSKLKWLTADCKRNFEKSVCFCQKIIKPNKSLKRQWGQHLDREENFSFHIKHQRLFFIIVREWFFYHYCERRTSNYQGSRVRISGWIATQARLCCKCNFKKIW